MPRGPKGENADLIGSNVHGMRVTTGEVEEIGQFGSGDIVEAWRRRMSRYFVYENWTHERARIHKSECGYCNDGRGTQAGSSNRNGKWHGPYDREGAFNAAKRLDRGDTKSCPNCAP
jgi:hypothetical protein